MSGLLGTLRFLKSVLPIHRVTLGILLALLPASEASSAELPPLEGRENLALNCPVAFSPAPNYGLTAKGESDTTDLTDGRLTRREDRAIWFDSLAVGWSYGGRVNLAVDLGRSARIDEVAIRLLGGTPQAGINIPGWTEVFVSQDGEHYTKVAECSRWRDGDFERYEVPDDAGTAWIHCLRFAELDVNARWIGLRMYTGGLSAADELYVFGKPIGQTAEANAPVKRTLLPFIPHVTGKSARPTGKKTSAARLEETPEPLAPGAMADFTVAHPQPYFHKPKLVVATNVPAPIPIGIVVPPETQTQQTGSVTLDLPPGVELCGGNIGSTKVEDVEPEKTPDGRIRYRLETSSKSSNKVLGRLYLMAPGWQDGQKGKLRYALTYGDWQSAPQEIPLSAVHIPPAPRLKRVMAGLGWWSATDTANWPDALRAWKQFGLNSFPMFSQHMKQDNPAWDLVDEARRQGMFLVNIDSPVHRMVERRKKQAEIFCQFADGSTGDKPCPSYRGQYYQEELKRFAGVMQRSRPDFASLDIEVWGWRGPVDCRTCTRCQRDFEKAESESWESWQLAKGDEMWRDLVREARLAVAEVDGPRFEIGGYDFRPGPGYQFTWSVDHLYPEWMQSSQVSTYSCLYPYHLELIGNRVREDRNRLQGADILPWLTPGDAGTFSGECFQWALLECYANGARGVYFWSGRVWDTESLTAYNRVIRAIAPVEELILEGKPIGEAVSVDAPGRISGIGHQNEMLLLVADYFRRSDGNLKVRLSLPAESEMRDLLTGQIVTQRIPAGESTVSVDLGDNRAQLLHVCPVR